VAAGAGTLLAAARERLAQWEVPDSEIEKLETTGKIITDLTFNSPVSGYITEKNALPNLYVQPETRLYIVADLSTVWVYAQVFQTDLGKVKRGEPAEVTVDAYPGKTFRGRVDYILPQIDMNTRTARVRVALPNPGLKLSPGMYVNVLLKNPLGRQLVVPASAIFHSGTRQLVFVSHGEGRLEPRDVQTGLQVGEQTIIVKGIRAGEPIVTSANFLIDSESQLQAAAGAFIPPPPGAGEASAMNVPAPNVELTTEPSPPRKGTNLVRVKLIGKNGAPVAGAQVTVTFYMPAMPAMGMSATKTIVTCADKGSGFYEGSGDLGSAGTWQVTVAAQQSGHTIANKQLTVNVTGGM
jgi:Cu(I)/Ag(I) efflux system membrane fusion protein/cobalt-zinc-cadmium efflux system membrane fusion protein